MPPNKPGDIIRYEEPPRSLGAAVVIVILSIAELAIVVAFMATLIFSKNDVYVQMVQAQMLFAILFTLGFILLVYRRSFMPDVLVVKVRNKKYEDFIDPNRVPKVD